MYCSTCPECIVQFKQIIGTGLHNRLLSIISNQLASLLASAADCAVLLHFHRYAGSSYERRRVRRLGIFVLLLAQAC